MPRIATVSGRGSEMTRTVMSANNHHHRALPRLVRRNGTDSSRRRRAFDQALKRSFCWRRSVSVSPPQIPWGSPIVVA